MPKKTQGRPARGKTKQRRPQPRPVAPPEVPPATPAPGITASAGASPVAPAAPRRGTGRRVATIAINYDYLRRDLTSLAVLAPLMVVLLIVAYFVFHTS